MLRSTRRDDASSPVPMCRDGGADGEYAVPMEHSPAASPQSPAPKSSLVNSSALTPAQLHALQFRLNRRHVVTYSILAVLCLVSFVCALRMPTDEGIVIPIDREKKPRREQLATPQPQPQGRVPFPTEPHTTTPENPTSGSSSEVVATRDVDKGGRPSLQRGVLGVTSCPSTTFLKWSSTDAPSDAAATSSEVFHFLPFGEVKSKDDQFRRVLEVIPGGCKAAADGQLKLRLCSTPNNPDVDAKAFQHVSVPKGTRQVVVVVDPAVARKKGLSHLCVAATCPGACDSRLDEPGMIEEESLPAGGAQTEGKKKQSKKSETNCAVFGQRNVLTTALPSPKTCKSEVASTNGARPLDVLLFLVDSVSWRDFNRSFPKTQSMLTSLEARGDHDVVRFPYSHATGLHSAVNHPPLFLGSHVDKCLAFKSGKAGIPKKGKAGYEAYKAMLSSVSTSAASLREGGGKELRRRHLIGQFAENGFETSMLFPLPYTAPEATCYGLDDETSFTRGGGAPICDDCRWRFFSEAVSMFNREINGSQGCIGDHHAMDYVDEFLADRFGSSGSVIEGCQAKKNRFAVIAEQTPHQRQWRPDMIEHYDARVAGALGRYFAPTAEGLKRDRVLVFLADHGLGFGIDRKSDAVPTMQDILNPAHIWVVPKGGSSSSAALASMAEGLKRNQRFHVSHFDVHAGLAELSQLTGSAGKKEVSSRGGHSRSIISAESGIGSRPETCDALGLFRQSCRLFQETSIDPSTVDQTAASYAVQFGDYVGRELRKLKKKSAKRPVCIDVASDVKKLSLAELQARLYPDGICVAAGQVRVKREGRQEEELFSFSTFGVRLTAKATLSECATMVRTPRDLMARVGSVRRLSTYAADERACGVAARRLDPAVDLQLCMCLQGSSAGDAGPGFLGG